MTSPFTTLHHQRVRTKLYRFDRMLVSTNSRYADDARRLEFLNARTGW